MNTQCTQKACRVLGKHIHGARSGFRNRLDTPKSYGVNDTPTRHRSKKYEDRDATPVDGLFEHGLRFNVDAARHALSAAKRHPSAACP